MSVRSKLAPTVLSTLFAGLADPARLACVLVVREHPRTVSEVVAATGLSQPNVSKHLACLRECGLVRAERSGRYLTYQLAHTGVETLLHAAEALLADVGASVAAWPQLWAGGVSISIQARRGTLVHLVRERQTGE